MSLQILQSLKSLSKEKVTHNYSNTAIPDDENHVSILHPRNTVCFRLQEGDGVKNGCSLSSIVELVLLVLNAANRASPSQKGTMAVSQLSTALTTMKAAKM